MVSPDDRLPALVIRAGDYLTLGVRVTWIIGTRQRLIYSEQGTGESPDAILRHGQIELPIAELLAQL